MRSACVRRSTSPPPWRFSITSPSLRSREAAARRLTPQPEGVRRSRLHLSEDRFGSVPRVYIEALQDRSVHLPLQRKMQELTPCLVTYALESDHAPQLSQPDALAELLLQAAARNARAI